MSTPDHREPFADAFCHGDDVGFDAVVLMGEELAAASVAALDFIENQDRVVFRTSLAESCMNSSVGSWMPPTPCMPSIITAQTSPLDNSASWLRCRSTGGR